MIEPIWLEANLVTAIQSEQIATFGGAAGIRDPAMLDSALGRLSNKWTYGEESLAVLAAAYGFALAKNHPFVDGNKRTAFLSMSVFLGLNGFDLDADEMQAVLTMEQLASGLLSEYSLAVWVQQNITPES